MTKNLRFILDNIKPGGALEDGLNNMEHGLFSEVGNILEKFEIVIRKAVIKECADVCEDKGTEWVVKQRILNLLQELEETD